MLKHKKTWSVLPIRY